MTVRSARAAFAVVVFTLTGIFVRIDELDQEPLPKHGEDEEAGDPNGQPCKNTPPHGMHSPHSRGQRATVQADCSLRQIGAQVGLEHIALAEPLGERDDLRRNRIGAVDHDVLRRVDPTIGAAARRIDAEHGPA